MEMISKNFNQISKGLSSIIIILLFLTALLFLTSIQQIFGQEGVTNQTIMNASIKQLIGIVLSGNLTKGIFFTNRTTIGTQEPIEDMWNWNNATGNYYGENFGTEYYVEAPSGNLIDIKVCHCVCSHLKCVNSSLCANNEILINGTGTAEGVGWANATTPQEVAHQPAYRFNQTDFYLIVNESLPKNGRVYLRYWLDPYPNSTPSGPYQANYTFKAVDYTTSCGICNCD
ncbi:MAG: hypothetical protein QW472_05570 [Candidatus Aenigmatarchaeota archaeon]